MLSAVNVPSVVHCALIRVLFLCVFLSFGVESSSGEKSVVALRPESAASMLCADVATDMLQSPQSSGKVLVDEYYFRKQRRLDVKMQCFE